MDKTKVLGPGMSKTLRKSTGEARVDILILPNWVPQTRGAAVQVIGTKVGGSQSSVTCLCRRRGFCNPLLLWAGYKIVHYKNICEF